MDLNFHYLAPDEVKLIQDISIAYINLRNPATKSPTKSVPFTFRKTRDDVDVIIVKNHDTTGFEEEVLEEEKEIRKIIEEERKRREDEPEDGIDVIEWPRLPSFEGLDDDDPFGWDDDLQPFDDDAVYDKEQWLERFRNELWNDDSFDSDERWYTKRIDKAENRRDKESLIEQLEFIRKKHEQKEADLYHDFADSREGLVIGGLDNFQLLQLDARLRQLKCYLYRLAQDKNKGWWSGSLLGCYLTRRNNKGKRVLRHIYLFIDTIDNYANGAGYSSREPVLASTFIHEMFHAYYNDVESKSFIVSHLTGVREIEEAMAEFGMLCFLEQFNLGYHVFAYKDVTAKLNSGLAYLQCYGLGASLYDEWRNQSFPDFHASIFAIYQKIQPAPRYGIKTVDTYRRLTRRPVSGTNIWKCLKQYYRIIYYFHRRIANTGQHYLFGNVTGGFSNRVVYSVLRYYIQYVTPTPDYAQMEMDFDNNASIFGRFHIFQDLGALKPNEYTNYDLNQNLPALKNGVQIVPAKTWLSGIGDNMEAFIRQVIRLYKKGVINQRILVLR